MANGTLTEEEERLLMERMAAKAANPAVNIATDLSASYVPAKYTPTKYADPLDVFKTLVPEYTQYTPHGDTWLGGTGPQIDEHGNVKVWRGETSKNLDAVSGVKFFGLDPAPSNWATISDPSQDIHPMVTQHSGGFTKYGTITPEEAIRGYGYVSGHGTVPDMHEITFTPQEADKVKPGGPAVAKTIHTVPDYAAGHPSGKAKTDAIKALDLPLPGSGEKIPGTGVETSMLGKYGPALKGAGRFLGLAGYPMSAMAASDYWGAGKPVRAAMAAGSALPVVGMPLLAAEMLTNAVDDGILPEDMPVSPTRFGSDEPYAGMGSVGVDTPFSMETPHPGQALGHTTLDPSTPGAYLPDFDVTGDAGGAVGGHPVMDTIEDWGDPTILSTPAFDAARPSESTLSVDSWSPNWDTMENMYAGTNAFGIPDKTYGPVSKTHSELLADTAATNKMHTNVTNMINKLGNTGMLAGTAQQYGYSHPYQEMWSDHPYMSSEDAMFSQGMKQMQDYQDYGPFAALGYAAGQPIDEISKALGLRGSLQPASLRGTLAQMASPMAGVQQDNIPALVDDIVASRVHGITSTNRPNFGTGALANPNISVQDTIDTTYNENIGMGQVASHPGQGGYIDDTERTIGEHLAAANERVQAMPAVTTSQALSTQDERQQAMPEVSVPAPTAPTVAAVAAQDRLAQMQADAAMRRAAQQAAAQDAARLAAQRAAVQADIAAAQAEQDRIAQAKAIMDKYAGTDRDMSAEERDIVAAANVDTFAGIERQIRGDSDTAGERSAGMGGGRGGFAGPDRW